MSKATKILTIYFHRLNINLYIQVLCEFQNTSYINIAFKKTKFQKKKKITVAHGTLKRVLAFPTLNDVLSYKGRLSHILHDLSFSRGMLFGFVSFSGVFFFSAFCLVWVVSKAVEKK